MAQETGVQKVQPSKPLVEENSTRQFTGYAKVIVGVIAIAMAAFQLYTAATLPIGTTSQMAVHLAFALTLVFLYYPAFKGQKKFYFFDILLILASLAFNIRILTLPTAGFSPFQTAFLGPLDRVLALVAVIVVLEATRRTGGIPLMVTTLVFILYDFAGPFFPGAFRHQGYSLDRFLSMVYATPHGIYGLALDASATMIFVLVLYGGFLLALGAGQAFVEIAVALMGHVRGGPAKIAIIGSGLFGTMSGSILANVSTIGVMTIPLMKRVGYKPHWAAAVEATASKGGQIMPPVMGTAAFIMAEILNIGYNKIIVAAAIPAVLYYFAIFSGVDFEAAKTGLKGMPREELPKLKDVVRRNWYLYLSPLLLAFLIVGLQWGPAKAAFLAIVLTVVVDFIQQFYVLKRVDLSLVLSRIYGGIENGVRTGIMIASLTATIGLILGSIDLTGLSILWADLMLSIAGENILLLLIFTMIASLILGISLPTTVCYVLLAVTAAPVMIKAGVDPIAAHLFVFYFGLLADLTPPVALSAYVAAGIAGAPPMKTAFTAMRLAWASYVMPYMFVFAPALLMKGSLLEIVQTAVTAAIAIVLFSAGSEGYLLSNLNWVQRIALMAGSLMLIPQSLTWDIIGLAIVTPMVAWNLVDTRRTRRAKEPIPEQVTKAY